VLPECSEAKPSLKLLSNVVSLAFFDNSPRARRNL
jgi:hypothetical protein